MTITHPAQIHDTFTKAVNAKDVEAVLDLYDHEGINVELDGSQTTGHDPMRSSFEGLIGAIRHIDGTTRKLFVTRDVALSSASWTAEIVLPDGTVVTQQGTTAEVSLRQPDGTWRIVIDDPMFGTAS